jgi:2-oxoglutarate ferredoxin oxidoreductase subunit alpha
MQRTVVKMAGESGMGLLSSGQILSRALKKLGYYIVSDREYPSLIKGGHSCMQIDFSDEKIRSLSTQTDVVVAFDRKGLIEYIDTMKDGGILIHGYERHNLVPALKEKTEKKNIKVIYLPARELAFSLGGDELMVNMILMGILWKVLGLDFKDIEAQVSIQFASKPKLLEIDLKCIKAGYEAKEINGISLAVKKPAKVPETILIDGTRSLCLGAIQSGVRCFFAYPMSPASGVLTYLGAKSHETGMVIKQAEDEITAVQMTIGSMHMGARALTASSGGGYDLMTETVSLSGITETPLVVIIGQRPGPGTGLPTWTGQGDFNLAVHSSHGEFPRVVVACSDPESSYELIQHSFNIAEKFQIPVIVLSEKVVLESHLTVDPFKENLIPIERGLVTDQKELEALQRTDRFKFTDNGVSKRWLPGTSPAYYYANSDEHTESGVLTEEGDAVNKMYSKRMKKIDTIKKEIPDPVIYGDANADISFIGWGSSKNAMLDAIKSCEEKGIKVNYLHYDYVWPLKEEPAKKFFENNKNVYLIEGNYEGQFGEIVEQKTKKQFKGRFLKYNGRAFYLEDLMEFITKNVK